MTEEAKHESGLPASCPVRSAITASIATIHDVKDLYERAPKGRAQPADLHRRNWFPFHSGSDVGGAYRDRTDDPLLAKQVLSQLS